MGAKQHTRQGRRRPCEHCLQRRRRVLLSTGIIAGVATAVGLSVSLEVSNPIGTATVADFAVAPTVTYAASRPTVAEANDQLILARVKAHDVAAVLAFETPKPKVTHVVQAAQHVTPVTVATTSAAAPATTYTPPPPPTPTPTPTPTWTPTPTPAVSTPQADNGSVGSRLLAEAETQQGVPYTYGGASPGTGFDCSGLIYWSALQIGITSMPRDTFEMLGQGVSSGLLVPTSNPQPGDLAFFGTGHVELYVSTGRFFGAQQTGTLVGYHDYGNYYVPTQYYYVS